MCVWGGGGGECVCMRGCVHTCMCTCVNEVHNYVCGGVF